MHADLALRMMADLFATGFLVSLPLLGATLAVGLVVSVLQVATQVQEMTLSFVPKLFVAGAVLIATGPWMLRTLTQFTARLWGGIPALF